MKSFGNTRVQSFDSQVLSLGQGAIAMDAASVDSGMAFLVGELEKRDMELNEPLTSVTWPRDIVANTGGGWVESTSNMFADYRTTGGNEHGLMRGQTNNLPIVQGDVSKDVFKVYAWSNVLKVPFIDQQKLQKIGRSLNEILDNGIKLNYNKTLDQMVYEGLPEDDVYGLVNNPAITATAATAGASTKTTWKDKTPDEILDDINQALTKTWADSEYDLSGMANHILIPPSEYSYLVSRKVSDAGNVSLLNYLLENNIAKNQGVELVISPSRWCTGAGTGDTNRMVAYVNAKNRVCIDIPVPMMRSFTETSAKDLAYYTPYVANIGQVKFLYHQCALYVDGI
ncbi:hypothetical protein EUAN_08630 [Andreesenia angusta]|uniref:Encapsulating protein for peroxidase n=1 Tax=Andreesenia angusta TaxID=39480 RepID=A0A1S1VB69_9FIRM|nr:DUF2184 domain-containing protein [Andreesenia angusta]OHW63079.1 hypothetical protein EUAN_08630 [Andreesenia angusta]